MDANSTRQRFYHAPMRAKDAEPLIQAFMMD